MKTVLAQEAALKRVGGEFATLHNTLHDSDMPATTQTIAAVQAAQKKLGELLKK